MDKLTTVPFDKKLSLPLACYFWYRYQLPSLTCYTPTNAHTPVKNALWYGKAGRRVLYTLKNTCTGVNTVLTYKKNISVRVSHVEISMHASKIHGSCKDFYLCLITGILDTDDQKRQDGTSPPHIELRPPQTENLELWLNVIITLTKCIWLRRMRKRMLVRFLQIRNAMRSTQRKK